MKVRSGFVSNSSSSSFVCIGIDISENEELKAKFVDTEDYELTKEGKKALPKNTSYGYYEGCGEVIGWVLGSGSDYEFTVHEVDFDELKKYAEALEKATGIKPKIIGGTYAC